MDKLKNFFLTSLIGGMVVVLPLAILIFVLRWLFNLIIKIVQPLTTLIFPDEISQTIMANVLVVFLILFFCFLVGAVVRTKMGGFLYTAFENRVLKITPGYSVIKETVVQFLGNKKSPFSSTALVDLYGNGTLVSAFITDVHKNGSYTVFVPTAPNPTSGFVYHASADQVHEIDVPVEEMMRSILSCGAGSHNLIEGYLKRLEMRDKM
jgi:uncharacterized membrane protein